MNLDLAIVPPTILSPYGPRGAPLHHIAERCNHA